MFYQRLEGLCIAQGMSVSQVCVLAGMNRTSCHMWKKGNKPTVTSVCKLAAVLGVSPTYLLHGEEESPEVQGGPKGMDTYMRELMLTVSHLDSADRVKVMTLAQKLLREKKKTFTYTA